MTARTPKYLHIKNSILEDIREGRLAAGSQIDSISEIMERFQVSKVTAVRALADLEAEGIVRREHGRGTFVMDNGGGSPARTRKVVAVIVPEMTNPFHVEVVGSIERHLRDAGVAIELSCTDYQTKVEQELFHRAMTENRTAGTVLVSGYRTQSVVNGAPLRPPLVVVDHCPQDLVGKCIFISSDNYKGGYDAAAHLVGLGHRRIGYIQYVFASESRQRGFRKGLEDGGVPWEASRMYEVGPGGRVHEDLVEFVRREQLTALFAVNDMLAMQAMKRLRSKGYRIPDDVSLMGYDDVAAARYLDVPLTTIEQFEEQIGNKAAECLLDALSYKGNAARPREIVIVPRLVVRASTAPPAR